MHSSAVESVHERLADDVFDLLGELGGEWDKLCAAAVSDPKRRTRISA